jgi:hypothetical protein
MFPERTGSDGQTRSLPLTRSGPRPRSETVPHQLEREQFPKSALRVGSTAFRSHSVIGGGGQIAANYEFVPENPASRETRSGATVVLTTWLDLLFFTGNSDKAAPRREVDRELLLLQLRSVVGHHGHRLTDLLRDAVEKDFLAVG